MDNRSYGRGYVEGYEAGLREAWAELIGLTTQSYTGQEMRYVAKTKADSIGERVSKKRFTMEDELGVSLSERSERLSSSGISLQRFEPKKAYILASKDKQRSMDVYTGLAELGMDILGIFRENPDILIETMPLQKQVVWISMQSVPPDSAYQTISPKDMANLTSMIRDFIKEHKNAVVFIEGIEYLILQNDMDSVRRFLNRIKDLITISSSALLIHMDPGQLGPNELHRLSSEIGEIL